MSGFILVQRAIWDDPDFDDGEMSQREAFLWMVAHAAWRETTVRVGKIVVELERGQLAFSQRFLAEKWGWSKSRVNRFLSVLEKRNTIGTDSGTGVCVVTICNYCKYQDMRDSSGTLCETEAGQQRDSSGTKKKPLKPLNAMLCTRVREAAGLEESDLTPDLMDTEPIEQLLNPVSGEPCDLERDVLPAIAVGAAKLSEKSQTLKTWRYFHDAIIENRDRRLSGLAPVQFQPASTAAGGRASHSGARDDHNPARRLRKRMAVMAAGRDYDGGLPKQDEGFVIEAVPVFAKGHG